MPVKDIPDLGWTKPEEKKEEPKPKGKRQESKTEPPKQPQHEGPVLRSSKKQSTTTEVNVEAIKTTVESKEQITSKFLSCSHNNSSNDIHCSLQIN